MAYHGPPLSRGAVRAVVNGSPDLHPVLQVIDVKKIAAANAGPGTPERYRLVLSDTENYQQAMLATQLNDLVVSGAIKKNTIIRVDECVAAAGARREGAARAERAAF